MPCMLAALLHLEEASVTQKMHMPLGCSSDGHQLQWNSNCIKCAGVCVVLKEARALQVILVAIVKVGGAHMHGCETCRLPGSLRLGC